MSTSPLPMTAEFSANQYQNVYILSSSDLEQLRTYVDRFVQIIAREETETQHELATEATDSEWQKSALQDKCRVLASYRRQLVALQHNPYPTVEEFSHLTTILDGLALQSAERLLQVSRSEDATAQQLGDAQRNYTELAEAITSPGYSVILKDPANPMQPDLDKTTLSKINSSALTTQPMQAEFAAKISAILSPANQQPFGDSAENADMLPDDMPTGPSLRIYPPSHQA